MPQLSSILLVDDDATTNFLNQLLLKRMAVAQHVLVAENGAEALQLLHQTCVPLTTSCPNLVLLDLNMPVLNGVQFLQAYARLPLSQQQRIIIILLTTSLLPQELERVQQLPVAGVLNKPLTREKVAHLLQQHF